MGPVAGILHAAGVNVPRRLETLDEAAFRETLAPKLAGLRNLLAAVRAERLRLLVAFGRSSAGPGWLARPITASPTSG